VNRRAFLVHSSSLLSLALIGCKSGPADPDPSDPPPDPVGNTGDTGLPADGPPRLFIPPELLGADQNGRKLFELTIQAGTHEFFRGMPAASLGYNGGLLGPTLRARRGDALTIRVTNTLDVETTTHWHGAHLPAGADGGPHQIIAPGETWVSEWEVDQVGCTNWYHPHREGTTAEQVYHGLAGLFILDDPEHDALDLPRRYGVDDIPIILQDRRFRANGELDYNLSNMERRMGFDGDTFLVNGDIQPFVEVEAKQVRFRILNGSNARVYRLELHDGTAFQLIGVDNSLLDSPSELSSLLMSPGERAEIVVDLSARLGDALRLMDTRSGVGLVEVRVSNEPAELTTLPNTLVTLDRVDPAEAVRTRDFVLSVGMGPNGAFRINGVSMDIDVINEQVPIDEVEIWALRNTSMMTHNFHMHATHFEVISRNGGPPEPHESGFKDTVRLDAGDDIRVVVRHRDYADPTQPYMYHCHILEHEDQGMMGQFVVV